MSLQEYVGWMTRLGRFGESAAAPEHDPRVCARYLELHARWLGGPLEAPVVAVPRGLGFYRDPLADGGAWAWALVGALSHPVVPLAGPEIVAAAEAIAATLADDCGDSLVMTDTFEAEGLGEPTAAAGESFAWLSSPRARFAGSFSEYLASLTADRRRAARELLARFDESAGFRFALTPEPPSEAELTWVAGQLSRQWGEDAGYALAQHLWPVAVAAVRPAQALFMRVHDRDALAYFNGYLVRGDVITSQSTSRNLDLRHDGLGVVIDLKAIARLIDAFPAVRRLDPTCRTGLDDPPSIGVAKRKVVNEDAYKPVLLLGETTPECAAGLPRFVPGRGWVAGTAGIVGRRM
ncbi:hypothetical protein SAMN02745121_00835 [Nannocystis exedens]|uniref:Acetyltransferase (GNAT) domain-containing protein n=2 Tax=Nannocystis exedens TaxID=54 RepID=A0A1I1TZ61_9BACT|nr:hypothetical protein NAEX_04369 [Nannocystis exedens]SFD63867.1 hypothetical protein SAMN02745121_00835 [Nannocystis exedens]